MDNPKGSILPPCLFNRCTKDLGETIFRIFIYSGDMTLTFKIPKFNNMEKHFHRI